MTEKKRREAVKQFNDLMGKKGTHRKQVIMIVCAEYSIHRATLYRWMARCDNLRQRRD